MRMMRRSSSPAILRHSSNASSSLGVDRGQEPVLGQTVLLGDQVPGKLDRQRLEVVAEAEIAQHLEEGVVPGGVADIVEIVVLAAGADAFLRGGGALVGPLLDAGEHVLELHHAGVGEHQGRVVVRHQRRGGARSRAHAGGNTRERPCGSRWRSACVNCPAAPLVRARPSAGSLDVADGATCGRDIRWRRPPRQCRRPGTLRRPLGLSQVQIANRQDASTRLQIARIAEQPGLVAEIAARMP